MFYLNTVGHDRYSCKTSVDLYLFISSLYYSTYTIILPVLPIQFYNLFKGVLCVLARRGINIVQTET